MFCIALANFKPREKKPEDYHTNSIQRNTKFHLLGRLLPSSQILVPCRELQRQLFPLRNRERYILHVEL